MGGPFGPPAQFLDGGSASFFFTLLAEQPKISAFLGLLGARLSPVIEFDLISIQLHASVPLTCVTIF